MSDRQQQRDVNGDNHPRIQHQANMGQHPPSSDVVSKILGSLGLETTGSEVWQKHIREIEKLVKEGNKYAAEDIASFLDDKLYDKNVRMEALRSLLELSKRSTSLVLPGPFIRALDDEDPQVRATAVEVITAYGAWRLPDRVLLDLMKKLTSTNKQEGEEVRFMIVYMLASLAKRAPLTPVLPNDYYSSIASISKEAFRSLRVALQDECYQVREAAVIALRPLVKDLPPDQREQFDAMIYDDDEDVRTTARLILEEQLSSRQALEERLRNDLLAPSSTRRSQAARSLGEIGKLEPSSLRALLKVAQDPQTKSEVREAALLSLAGLHLSREAINKDVLDRLLEDESESVQAAARILGNALDPDRYLLEEDQSGKAIIEKPVPGNVIDFEQHLKQKTLPKDNDLHGAGA
jgi:HEAT repeat protein